MAFQKKERVAACDTRPQGNKLQQREQLVKTLKKLNTPEARKELKRMNDTLYRRGRSNLNNWYSPKGNKTSANGKQTRRA